MFIKTKKHTTLQSTTESNAGFKFDHKCHNIGQNIVLIVARWQCSAILNYNSLKKWTKYAKACLEQRHRHTDRTII